MWESSNSKRAGAHINRVKTLERTGLNRNSFNSLDFGSFNNAPEHKPAAPRASCTSGVPMGTLLGRPLVPAKKASPSDEAVFI